MNETCEGQKYCMNCNMDLEFFYLLLIILAKL